MTEEKETGPTEGPEEQAKPEQGVEQTLPETKAVETEQPAGVDELAELREGLVQARAKEAEYLDGWQRARAELANARKRFQREQEQSYANAQCDVLARLLPILDDFERALSTLPHNLSGLTWIEGVLLIHRKLQWLLEQAGVAVIDAAGQPFDPFAHQAITHEPSQTVPEGHVIAELQKGYKVGDRILRPSLVRVSSGKLAGAEETVPEEAPSK